MINNGPDLPPYQANFLYEQPQDAIPESLSDKVILDSLGTYGKDKIKALQQAVLDVDGEEGYSHIIDLAREWGPRSDNLDLVNPKDINKRLTHAYYLTKLAIDLQDEGLDVILIESTNNLNIRCFQDIDLVCKYKGSYLFADVIVTKKHGLKYSKYAMKVDEWNITMYGDEITNSLVKDKLKKLTFKMMYDHGSIVASPVDHVPITYNLKFDMDESCPYGDDFQKLNKMLSLAREFTVGEVEEIVRVVSPRLKDTELEPGLIRSYPKLSGVYDQSSVVSCLSKNDTESSRYHLKVLSYMRELKDKDKSDSYNLYSGDITDKLYDVMPTSTFFNPCSTIRNLNTSDMDMVERSGQLVKHMLKIGKQAPPLTLIASLCTDDLFHPTKEEIVMYGHTVSGPGWGKVFLRRNKQVESRKMRRGKDVKNSDKEENMCHFFTCKVSEVYENYNEYMYGGHSVGGFMTSMDRGSNTPELVFPDEYESSLDEISDSLFQPMSTGGHVELLEKLAKDSMPDTGKTGNLMRNLLDKTLDEVRQTKLMNWLETMHMTAESLSNIKKSAKHYETLKKNTSHQFSLYVSEVGDRNCLIFATTSFSSVSSNDCSVCIEGDISSPDTTGLIISRNNGCKTNWFNMSRSDHDWQIESFPDFVSYYSMLSDMSTSLEPHLNRKKELARDATFGLGLMLMNNTRFCQVSNEVRHMFNNCAGISNGTMDLYKKLDWYEPEKFIECLYMLRMNKMTNMMQLLKANDNIEAALSNYTSEIVDGRQVIGYKKSHWKVAMPPNSRNMPTDQRLYSSFYTSYAYANNRYNLLFLQSQVLLKQIDSREKFVIYRKSPRATDVSNLPYFTDKQALAKSMKDNIFTDFNGGQHKPCHLMVTLSSMTSLIHIHKKTIRDKSTLISDIVDRNYESTNIFNAPSIASVANNRSSVLSRGIGGNIPATQTREEKKDNKGKSRITSILQNQTAKGYETLFLEVLSFVQNKGMPHHCNLGIDVRKWEYKKAHRLDSKDIIELTKHTSKLWPTLLHSILNNHAVVARMIHKDDQKPREIAVMNMFLRLIAFYIEEVSRAIMAVEHEHEDYTNLIEKPTKDKMAAKTYINYKGHRATGKKVIFDNEDKSGWGPSQDCRVMYITLGLRMTLDKLRDLLGLLFQRFSKKHFKVPDRIFLESQKPRKVPISLKSTRGRAMQYLQTSVPNVYDKKRGCLYASEGMFQGTLSVSSSCSAADCMRFSCYVNAHIYHDHGYDSQGHVTSDDSVRAMKFDSEYHYYPMVRKTLHVHNEISKNYSYKRNMSCSVHSTYVFELNSVFHTSDGKIIPSWKSRLSFVTFSHELEMYGAAVDIVSKTAEYVRLESSVMGALWVQILKTWCHIRQFQLSNLYNRMGSKIFEVPLELGGLPLIDPLLTVSASSLSSYFKNYGSDFGTLLTFFNDTSKYETNITEELSQQEIENLNIMQTVPKMTRSSVTSLSMRECKDKRIIRETVMSLDPVMFQNLSKSGGSVMKALMGCFSREGVYFAESGLVNRYSLPQVPYKSKIYYLSNGLVRKMFSGEKRVSREDIHNMAESITIRPGCVETEKDMFDVERSYMDVARSMRADHDDYYITMQGLDPIKCVPTLPSSYISKIPDSYVESDSVTFEIEKFKKHYKPTVLGGNTSIHPVLYTDMSNTFSQKLRKMVFRIQRFKFTSNGKPIESRVQRLLHTNFIEGSSLLFTDIPSLEIRSVENYGDRLLTLLDNPIFFSVEEEPVTLERVVSTGIVPNIMDITGIMSHGTSVCPSEWGSKTTSLRSFQSLMSAKSDSGQIKIGRRYVNLCMTRPGLSSVQVIYHLKDIYLSQHKFDYTNTGISSKVVERVGDNYVHFVTIWSGTISELTDSGNERYTYLDLSSQKHCQLELRTRSGILCAVHCDHILMAICRDKYGLGEAQIISSRFSDLITKDVVRDHYMEVDTDVYEIYRDLARFRADIDVADLKVVDRESDPDPLLLEQGRINKQIEDELDAYDEISNNSSKSAKESDSDDYSFRDVIDDDPDGVDLGSLGLSLGSSDPESEVEEDDVEAFDNVVEIETDICTDVQSEIVSGDRDDPTPDNYQIHEMIDRYGFTIVSPVMAQILRGRGLKLANYAWALSMPTEVEVRMKSDNLMRDILGRLADVYDTGSIDYMFCKYYLLQCALTMPGEDHRYMRYRTEIRNEAIAQVEMTEEEADNMIRGLGVNMDRELRWND